MTIDVTVPATIANLGPGFDALAMAVQVRDRFRMSTAEASRVTVRGAAASVLSSVPKPLVLQAAQAVAARAGRRQEFIIDLETAIPPARGLGSSAASIVGGLVAANHLLGQPLDQPALLEEAAELEGHPDNVAAALLGGVVVIVREGERLRYSRFLPALEPYVIVAVPALDLPTHEARRLLPDQVGLRDAVFNLGRASLLVAALLTGDPDALPAALDDRLHQPYRAPRIPGFADVVAAAKEAGAYGAVLSGAGSSVAAFAASWRSEAVGEAMRQAFAHHRVASDILVTQIDRQGAVVHDSV